VARGSKLLWLRLCRAALLAFVPHLGAVAVWIPMVNGPAERVGDAFLRLASDGYDCEVSVWGDRLLQAFALILFVFVGWLEFFAIGFIAGILVDTLALVKRALSRALSPA
jgi:hypothetical protein